MSLFIASSLSNVLSLLFSFHFIAFVLMLISSKNFTKSGIIDSNNKLIMFLSMIFIITLIVWKVNSYCIYFANIIDFPYFTRWVLQFSIFLINSLKYFTEISLDSRQFNFEIIINFNILEKKFLK